MNYSKLILLCLSLLLVDTLSAQTTLGVKAGYTNAWPEYGDIQLPENAQTSVNGFNVSLTAYKSLGNIFSVGVEPGFVKRGMACMPGWQPIFQGDTKLLLDYVELPLFISSKFNLFKTNFSVNAGIGYGAAVVTSAMREIMNVAGDQVLDRQKMASGEDDSLLNKIDHGAYGKLGVGYDFKFGQLFFESSFYAGMRDVERFNVSKNRSINYSLGYNFSF